MGEAVIAKEETASEEDETEKSYLEEGLDDNITEHGACDNALVSRVWFSKEKGI